MEISNLIGTDGAAATPANEATLGREDFLKMLIAQLENQDPLNPQESTEFTAQLAQFSSLEQEIAMRSSLERITGLLDRGEASTAIDLIGQEVLAESAHFELGTTGSPKLYFDLATASDATRVQILDRNGDLVRSYELGDQPAGLGELTWDGRDGSGNLRPPGVYALQIDANLDLDTVPATPLIRGTVSGADISTSQPTLRVGDVVVSMLGLREVTRPGFGAAP